MIDLQHASSASKPTLHLQIPPDPRFARTVRDALIGFALLHGVPDADLESLLVAVGEALANAIEHAQTMADISVFLQIGDEELVATVIDEGRGFGCVPAGMVPLPDGLSERGRGIPIMQRCTDRFTIDTHPGRGTVITLGRLIRIGNQETSAIL